MARRERAREAEGAAEREDVKKQRERQRGEKQKLREQQRENQALRDIIWSAVPLPRFIQFLG